MVEIVAIGFSYIAGQTPIDADEAAGLVPTHLASQGQLNQWEQQNILDALGWLSTVGNRDTLTEPFCRELHRRMFGRTWRWAGQFRRSNKNIGCDWHEIAHRLAQLLGNFSYRADRGAEDFQELAVRFHHELVLIHPFPNGNGRHARMMADRWLQQLSIPPLSWGAGRDLTLHGDVRKQYIDGLRAADRGDIGPLLVFARSWMHKAKRPA